jgi:hypothetical protein
MRKSIILVCLFTSCTVIPNQQQTVLRTSSFQDAFITPTQLPIASDRNVIIPVPNPFPTPTIGWAIQGVDTPPDSTLYYMVVNNDTVYRQYPDTVIVNGDSAVNNWLALGFYVSFSGNKILRAPDKKDFKYIKQIP